MRSLRLAALIMAASLPLSLISCSLRNDDKKDKTSKKEKTSSADESSEKTTSKKSDNDSPASDLTDIDLDTVRGHVEDLLSDIKEEDSSDAISEDIDILLSDLDELYTASARSSIDYYYHFDDEKYEDIYDMYDEELYVSYALIQFAFTKGYLSDEYSDMFEKYITDEEMPDYYGEPGMTLRRCEGYAKVDHDLLDEYLDDYFDIVYSDEYSDDEKDLLCAEIYLDILASYDTDTFYEQFNRDYSPDEICDITDHIKNEFIPVSDKLLEHFFDIKNSDDILSDPVKVDDYFAAIEEYVSKISPDAGKAAHDIQQNKLYTIASGDSSFTGSFTTDLPATDEAYIYIYDDDSYLGFLTAIHEFGHYYASSYDHTIAYFNDPNLDIAEVQSQGLSILFTQFYDDIYGEQAEGMKTITVFELVDSVISGFIIGEYEYSVLCGKDTLSPEDVVDLFYESMEDYDNGLHFYEITHLFEMPGYYISYGVSALAALDLLGDTLNDPEKAAERYEKIARVPSSSNEYQFRKALAQCGFHDVLSKDYISNLAAEIEKYAE